MWRRWEWWEEQAHGDTSALHLLEGRGEIAYIHLLYQSPSLYTLSPATVYIYSVCVDVQHLKHHGTHTFVHTLLPSTEGTLDSPFV